MGYLRRADGCLPLPGDALVASICLAMVVLRDDGPDPREFYVPYTTPSMLGRIFAMRFEQAETAKWLLLDKIGWRALRGIVVEPDRESEPGPELELVRDCGGGDSGRWPL